MFFQNPFDSEFVGSMIYADRQYNLTFKVPGNKNPHDSMICWNEGPFNFTGNNSFTINFSTPSLTPLTTYKGHKYFSPVVVTLPNTTGVTAETVVTTLNSDTNFAAWFTAELYATKQVRIKTNKSRLNQKTYISNTSAEKILGFNKGAGVNELLSYYNRHTIQNAPNYPDSAGQLVLLDESLAQDQAIISAAGFTPSAMKSDYQLLAGRAESFMFSYSTYDGSNRLSTTVEFPAGAVAGNLAKKTTYSYDGASTRILGVYEVPYVLTSSDVSTIVP